MPDIEYSIKFIPDDMYIRYFQRLSDAEEAELVEILKATEENAERYSEFKKLFDDNEMPEWHGVTDDEYVKLRMKFGAFSLKGKMPDRTERKTPKAGEIWRLKRRVRIFADSDYVTAALAPYVYILTEPEPFCPGNEESDELASEIREFYECLVLPVSMHVEFAEESDYMVPADNDIIGPEFMVMTNMESSLLAVCFDKYIGRLSPEMDRELMNLYFASNGMDFDQGLLERTSKGTSDKDRYDEKVKYKEIEYNNFQMYEQASELLPDIFSTPVAAEDIAEEQSPPLFAMAASIGFIMAPGTTFKSPKKEIVLFSDDEFRVKLILTKDGQIFVRINSAMENAEKKAVLLVVNKKDRNEIILKKEINLKEHSPEVQLKEILKGRLVEMSMLINNKPYFIINLRF